MTKEEHTWKGNEEMVEVVSRPASVREKNTKQSAYGSSDDESDTEGSNEEDGVKNAGGGMGPNSDARSIRSVTSVLSKIRSRDTESEREEARERVSISDRLASIGGRGRLSNPPESVSSDTLPVKVSS